MWGLGGQLVILVTMAVFLPVSRAKKRDVSAGAQGRDDDKQSDNLQSLQLCEEELPQTVEGQKDEGGSSSRTGVRVNTA